MEDQEREPGTSAFGILLRRYRLAAGLSQEALAERARMSTNGIGALERGYRRTPQRETLELLTAALALNDEQRREFEATAARSVLIRRGAAVTVGPWFDGATVKLPLALTSFVGQETELDEITRLVREHRLVTLTGTGGIGKTQTALQIAIALSDAGDAACFIGLAPVSDPSLVVAAIASALGVQELPNHPLLETLVTYLRNKALLLILDNCEHVIAQVAIVAATLLIGCPRVRILATSREPLKAAGERTFRLASLRVPSAEATPGLDAAGAAAYGAIALFRDRACAVDHHFTLTQENAPIVAEICRRLDGIPLAIELAAARVNLLSVKAIAERLDNRFLILTAGARTALPRQQTMRATIDWSYDLLAAPEQRLFEHLSVFAAGCTLAVAAKVCGSGKASDSNEVFDLLSSLLDKSLVVVDLEGSEPRYRLFESFRQYASEKLTMHGDQDVVARRHALAYLDLAEQLDRVLYYDQEAFRELAYKEMDNWRTVLRWALADRGDVLLGQRLIGIMRSEWVLFAVLEGQRWLVAALELVDERTPASVLAGLDYVGASIASVLSQDELQLARSRSAVARYRVIGDSLGIALAQSLEAQALLNFGRVAEAQSVLTEARSFASNLGNRWLLGYILRLFAYASTLDADLDKARRYIVEARQNYEAVGAKSDIAWSIEAHGAIEFRAGNAELALQHAAHALTIFRALHRARGIAWMLHHIIDYLVVLGRYDEAEENAHEGLEVARENSMDVAATYALQNLAVIAALRPQKEARRSEPFVRAARLYGFVNARLAAIGSARRWLDSPEDEPLYHRGLAIMRDALGGEAVEKLMVEGATLTEELAVAEARTI
ncbi:MAG: helix-turn-helix domain-containing protein [Candidatus Cybelea sp.]